MCSIGTIVSSLKSLLLASLKRASRDFEICANLNFSKASKISITSLR